MAKIYKEFSVHVPLTLLFFREMDQIILEGCKLHGPKDKTFSRIAKQIEKVTSKQVSLQLLFIMFACLCT